MFCVPLPRFEKIAIGTSERNAAAIPQPIPGTIEINCHNLSYVLLVSITEINITIDEITIGPHTFIQIRRFGDDLYDARPTAKLKAQIIISHISQESLLLIPMLMRAPSEQSLGRPTPNIKRSYMIVPWKIFQTIRQTPICLFSECLLASLKFVIRFAWDFL